MIKSARVTRARENCETNFIIYILLRSTVIVFNKKIPFHPEHTYPSSTHTYLALAFHANQGRTRRLCQVGNVVYEGKFMRKVEGIHSSSTSWDSQLLLRSEDSSGINKDRFLKLHYVSLFRRSKYSHYFPTQTRSNWSVP